MPLVEKVYDELNRLHSVAFTIWVMRVRELVTKHNRDIKKMSSNFRTEYENVGQVN